MRAAVLTIGLTVLLSGCAAKAAPAVLVSADEQMIAGDYDSALRLYDEFFQGFPEDGAAARARSTRVALERLQQAETTAQQLLRDSALQEDELARLRRELAASRAEVTRLRADLERLKLIELRLERRANHPDRPEGAVNR